MAERNEAVGAKTEERLLNLFVEDRKARLTQKASQTVCGRKLKGKGRSAKAEGKRFRKTEEYERLLREELEGYAEWRVLNGSDPLADEALSEKFGKEKDRLLRRLREEDEKERLRLKKEETERRLNGLDVSEKIEKATETTRRAAARKVLKHLSEKEVRLCVDPPAESELEGYGVKFPAKVTADNWENLFEKIDGTDAEVLDLNSLYGFRLPDFYKEVENKILKTVPEYAQAFADPETKEEAENAARRAVRNRLNPLGFRSPKFLSKYVAVSRKEAYEAIGKNPKHPELARLIEEKERTEAVIMDGIRLKVPDRYADLYPYAREIKRKFTIHAGPTNSGKTYEAMRRLAESESGVYLGPLRLLAFEQYEKLNREGVWCSLITGEEKIVVPDGTHEACTIEVADFAKEYETAVIDEAQMLGDPWRGGSWTSAILGIRAKNVEVCCAPHAVSLVEKLIRQCGDEYSIVRHERKTPLILEKDKFSFSEDVRKGDALIVFSKKSVHAVASELQRHGWKCSVVYGSLPYDVRRREAEKFDFRETDVVVATDAIGMGINLPIRRVVFLELDKFDGREMRQLQDEEIRQIAGRAGRMGRFPKGFVTSAWRRGVVRHALSSVQEDLKEAVTPFPKVLLEIDAPLSEIMRKWDSIPPQDGFMKADLSVKTELCRWCETITDDKSLIYDMITIPFDERNDEVSALWQDMVRAEVEGGRYPIADVLPSVSGNDKLEDLEVKHKISDLIWSYCDKFTDGGMNGEVMRAKREISEKITEILARQKLEGKTCRVCGRKLSFNYRYGICENCFSMKAF